MKKEILVTHIQHEANKKAVDEARTCPYCSNLGTVHPFNGGTFSTDYICDKCGTIWNVKHREIKARQKELVKELAQSSVETLEKINILGRPKATFPENWEEVYCKWKAGEITAVEAQKLTNRKPTTFYKLVKQWESR